MRIFCHILTTICFISVLQSHVHSQILEDKVIIAMHNSSDFMMNTVSNKGGFVWKYSSDLSEQWGEVPARKSMIWVQDPGTIGVGMMFLDVFEATGDSIYLGYAKKIAAVLIQGQHDSGGWHYFIDLDMTGVEKWYEDVLSKCWGWEEYYHYYGNCTFDDDVTAGATRYLMKLYLVTNESYYLSPLLKALDFVLESQYPNGGWPQRYPQKPENSNHGIPDYTSYFTLNDNVIQGNIFLLLNAWEHLEDKKYKKAAYRGMEFIRAAQLDPPQAGWSQQYDMGMNPAPARSYEPSSVMPGYTMGCINDLMTFYKMTGERRFLEGIPDAIAWIESSYLPESHKTNDRVTHAVFYEVGTNKPLYAHREGTSIEKGRYWVDYEPVNFPGHYGMQLTVDISALKKAFKRVESLSPENAIKDYVQDKNRSKPDQSINKDDVSRILIGLDNRGAWVEEISIPDYIDVVNNPPRKLQGISTETYIRNMKTLLDYLKSLQD